MSSHTTRPSKKTKTDDKSNEMTKKKQNKVEDMSSNGFLKVPAEVLGTIASYASVGDITNVLSTNRELFSCRDDTIPSLLKRMAKEDSLRMFEKLVVSGNTGVRWFRFQDPNDGDNGDNNSPFLKRILNEIKKGCRIGTALHVAAYYGHKSVVEELLTMGAPIEAKAMYGYTALHAAAREGHKEVVERLLDCGANLEAKDIFGRTVLHWAEKKVVETLLDRGADFEAKGNDGSTALHYAAGNGQKEVVEILLNRGSDIEAKDNEGRTAINGMRRFYVPDRRVHDEIATLLQNRGAKEKAYN